MNPLVNFNERGVALPAGCKDLIDVIRPSTRAGHHGDFSGAPSRHHESVGKLTEVPDRVCDLGHSQAWHTFLGISPLDSRLEVFAAKAHGEPVMGSVSIELNSGLVLATRQFFQAWQLRLPEDGPLPVSFVEAIPTFQIFRFEPLPQAAEVTALAHILFLYLRDVGGMALDGALRFRYDEVGEPGAREPDSVQ